MIKYRYQFRATETHYSNFLTWSEERNEQSEVCSRDQPLAQLI